MQHDDETSFARAQRETFERCSDVGSARTGQYGDSWSLEAIRPTFTRATLAELRLPSSLEPQALRLLLAAALIDVKESRLAANARLHDDSILDGINFRAIFFTWLREYRERDAS